MTDTLNDHDLKTALQKHIHWNGDSTGIHRTFTFKDFPAAIQFMGDAVDLIEALNHHPEWCNVYNRIEVTLRSHDADNQVTSRDFQVAHILDEQFLACS